jgi:hypothetical protein
MPNGQRRIRPWRATGLYRGKPATSAPTPAQQRSITGLREQFLTDHLRGDPTAGQQVILDLLVFAKIRHADAMAYLSTMPRPWIDRRSHRAWRVVEDLSRMERHIARLTLALVDPVLERRPQPVETLADYVAKKDAEGAKLPEGAKEAPRGQESQRDEVGPLGEGGPPEPGGETKVIPGVTLKPEPPEAPA